MSSPQSPLIHLVDDDEAVRDGLALLMRAVRDGLAALEPAGEDEQAVVAHPTREEGGVQVVGDQEALGGDPERVEALADRGADLRRTRRPRPGDAERDRRDLGGGAPFARGLVIDIVVIGHGLPFRGWRRRVPPVTP